MFLSRLMTTCAILLLCNYIFAQTQHKVNIKEATVFLNGAELSSTARVQLSAGETEVLFTNIAGNVNRQSLSIGADNSVVVQSATFQNNFLREDNFSPRAMEIRDSIDYLESKKKDLGNELETINEQVTIIRQNRQVSGANSGLSVTELQKMLDLVKTRMEKLLDEKDAIVVDIKKIDKRRELLHRQLDEENARGFQPGGQLLVKFYSPRATSTAVNISYVVPNAGWMPSYDLRVEDINSPVKLFYKAQVYQNSGVAWNDVKLTLSTGNPAEGAQAPTLNPWYLQFYTPRPPVYANQAYNNGVVGSYKRGEAAMDASVEVEEAKLTNSSMDRYVQVDNSGINTSFDIELAYTIPSDGQQHNVAVKKYELPATYRYYSVPKLDRDAFLQAQITNWEDLNLLPAQTNIFYEGTYVGQGYIDVRNVKDTMNISLGRDKKIVVRRERDKELRTVRTIGSNVKETFVYKISLRNTRNKPIDIVVLDQVPISNENNIEITDRELGGGAYNETTGAVTWKLKLQPNEQKELKFGYTVKYPKGTNINL